jgi:hypothetical protein
MHHCPAFDCFLAMREGPDLLMSALYLLSERSCRLADTSQHAYDGAPDYSVRPKLTVPGKKKGGPKTAMAHSLHFRAEANRLRLISAVQSNVAAGLRRYAG